MDTRKKEPPDHTKLYRIAEQQSGYFTAAQAAQAGFGGNLLVYHTKRGQFRRVARGVYRLAQFPSSPFEDLFVAWLRAGPNSVVSHESALALYDLSDVVPREIHLTVPRSASQRRKGIRQHTNLLRPADITLREGLPVTTVPRTIADVALAGVAEEQVRLAIREALDRGLATRDSLLAEAEQRKGRAARLIRETLGPTEESP